MMKWVLGWTLLLASALPGQAADPAHSGLKTQLKKTPALQSATPIPVQKPDLAITSMAWSNPIREGDKIGMSSILNLLIANRGGVETPPTTVRFVCTGGCPAVLTGSRPVPMIPAGQNLGVNWPDGLLATWPSGTFTLEAVVDPSGQVADGNRSNNRKKIVFTVVPSPPALHKKNVGEIQPASVINAIQRSIKVDSPAAGEVWRIDTAQTVFWTKVGDMGPRVDIALWDAKTDSLFRPVVNSAPNSGSYTIPAGFFNGLPFTDYRLRVETTDHSAVGKSSVFKLAATAFAERAPFQQKMSPQKPPQPLRGMSAAQFQPLTDSTLLELRGKTITKGELVRQMNAARSTALANAKAGSPKATALLQQKRDELLQKHKLQIEPMNAQVRARMVTVAKEKRIFTPQTPGITGVYGTVTPYGLVQITGNNFGEMPGSSRLRGNFPKNGDVVNLVVDQWFGDAVSGKVPWVGGAFDQTATIEVTPPGGKTVQHTVSFKPMININDLPPSMFSGKVCSTQASFHNECNISGATPGVIHFVSGLHQDIVGTNPMSNGVDTFSFGNLPAGFELVVSIIDGGSQATMCTATGKAISCTWTHPGVAPVSASDYATSYRFCTWALGPAEGLEPGL
jgi:hypothetical protein